MANKEVKENKQKRHYFKDMKAELKKVIWPTPKQTMNNTVAVIVFTLVIAIIVFVLDLCFDSINKYGVKPIQEKIQTSYSSSNNETTESESSEESNQENSETTGNTDAENIEVETSTSSEE